jgi:hypothetical protein
MAEEAWERRRGRDVQVEAARLPFRRCMGTGCTCMAPCVSRAVLLARRSESLKMRRSEGGIYDELAAS